MIQSGYHVLPSAVLQTVRTLTSSAVIPDILKDAQISGSFPCSCILMHGAQRQSSHSLEY